MPQKRPSTDGMPDAATPTRSKQAKTDYHGPDDFSNSVKRRLASSTRTGQACDRCKVRKIRCDGLAGGCSPCRQNNNECRTTDRITGRATSRGYVEGLEHQTQEMRARIDDLEARLLSLGVEVAANGQASHAPNDAPVMDWSANGNLQTWGPGGVAAGGASTAFRTTSLETSTSRGQEPNIFRALPVFRTGCNGDNYLGVSSGTSSLSSIEGTALSVLGMEIDIADFSSSDMDEPTNAIFETGLYNKSYQSFLQSAHNVNPKIEKVDLPPRSEGLTYAQWYFRVINPFLPILHKPSLLSTLTRMYDDPDFRPTPAEIVMVHMVFATMFFQYAARNWENAAQQADLNTRSNLHYHYSLGHFHHMSASHTLQDIQALTLICAHLRNFPKPGASWMVVNYVMTLAIEMGLHRSARRWLQTDLQKDVLEIELRKRVFYSILSIHVTLSGKLGRPMPVRVEDFDVELPEPIDDELLTEAGLDTSRPGRCAFRIGIEAFKVLPLFMELNSTLYAARRTPRTYIETVNRLEAKLKRWRERWPTELIQESAENEREGRVFSLYIQNWALEFRLLLRHPSVSLTSNANFNNASLDACVESAHQMLEIVKQLQRYKSLDTTWYQGAVYLMAITTTLFAQWEKRNEMNAVDLSNLRDEMDQWLSIMGDVGGLLGSGDRLKEAVRVVTDGTLGLLSRALTSDSSRTGSNVADGHPQARPGSHSPKGNDETFNTNAYNPSTFSGPSVANGAVNGQRGNGYISPQLNLSDTQPTTYPTTAQYTYPEPSSASAMTYPAHSNVGNVGDVFTAADAAYPGPDGSMRVNSVAAPSPGPQPANSAYSLFARPNAVAQTTGTYAPSWNPGSQSWRQWTGTMAGNLEPQDRYSASALMQLGGRGDLASGVAVEGGEASEGAGSQHQHQQAPVVEMSGPRGEAAQQQQQQQPWPLMVFDIGHGAGGA
ncbi:MAG: hypothetical protein M1832_005704 [Thelocarpon impressellum]|nr:MAG: hypothetical protein M1832_005704 [Thelocarpon impressellum]